MPKVGDQTRHKHQRHPLSTERLTSSIPMADAGDHKRPEHQVRARHARTGAPGISAGSRRGRKVSLLGVPESPDVLQRDDSEGVATAREGHEFRGDDPQ
eukprot:scaffold38_cov415-Prasinococcus_capsulatus_cf.AAC.17